MKEKDSLLTCPKFFALLGGFVIIGIFVVAFECMNRKVSRPTKISPTEIQDTLTVYIIKGKNNIDVKKICENDTFFKGKIYEEKILLLNNTGKQLTYYKILYSENATKSDVNSLNLIIENEEFFPIKSEEEVPEFFVKILDG